KVAGRVFKIRCKKCGAAIVVRGDQRAAAEATGASSESGAAGAGFDYGSEAAWHVVVEGEQQGPLTPAQLGELRASYLGLAARKADLGRGRRLVDKNPLNLLRLPAIRRLFPNSRIILAVRHPCDVALSCYLQHFRAPEFALLCRDLPALATAYDRAFRFWYDQAALLRPAVLEVKYESLVADFAAGSARIMEFLGLGLAPAQLDPAAHALARGYISTPSYSQVIEPVHGRSIGRWRRYADRFAPVLPRFQPWLERWGYGADGAQNSR
ncbi:MAG: sulfotransferase, partial [Gammaproteobacteria bacterium]|nr:sulfotransferase [Gammaproteobacteria bacterium]